MFQIYFTDRDAIHDYRDYCTYVDTHLYSRFVHRLLERGIYMTPSNGLHWIISTAHTEKDVAALIEAADRACAESRMKAARARMPSSFWVADASPVRCWPDCVWRITTSPSSCTIATRTNCASSNVEYE